VALKVKPHQHVYKTIGLINSISYVCSKWLNGCLQLELGFLQVTVFLHLYHNKMSLAENQALIEGSYLLKTQEMLLINPNVL